jgi:hypothetical protein
VQSAHKGVYWFGQERPYVQWIRLLLVLPCTRVLVVGVTSFREREQNLGFFGGSGVLCLFQSVVVRFVSFSHEASCASPFIVSKGRARVTFMAKR